jgi:hypothetical protein
MNYWRKYRSRIDANALPATILLRLSEASTFLKSNFLYCVWIFRTSDPERMWVNGPFSHEATNSVCHERATELQSWTKTMITWDPLFWAAGCADCGGVASRLHCETVCPLMPDCSCPDWIKKAVTFKRRLLCQLFGIESNAGTRIHPIPSSYDRVQGLASSCVKPLAEQGLRRALPTRGAISIRPTRSRAGRRSVSPDSGACLNQ